MLKEVKVERKQKLKMVWATSETPVPERRRIYEFGNQPAGTSTPPFGGCRILPHPLFRNLRHYSQCTAN